MTDKNRRRQLMVYPQVQYRMIAIFVLAGAVGFLGMAAGAVVFSQRMFALIEPYSASMTPESQLQLSTLWNYFWLFALGYGLLYVAGLSALGLIFSHRTAGPLFRLTSRLTKMIEAGHFEKIELRESDLFSDMAEQINEAIERRKSANGRGTNN